MREVQFTPTAADDLKRLDRPIAQRIFTKIRWLAENFDTLTPVALTGQWAGVYKLRVGDYRVLYGTPTSSKTETAAANPTITIHFVRHRREIYKTGARK